MLINDPETMAQLQKAFAEYEQALVANVVPTLDRLFWNSPHTLRYGAGENLYGFEEIQAFRNSRPAKNLDRTVLRTLRLLHYSAWIARRWDDPAFPAAFPWFGTQRYWQDRILELREQIALLDEPPLDIRP